DVAEEGDVGDAVARAREQRRGDQPLETRRQRLEPDHASRPPAFGPGVWLKMAVTRSRIATQGHTSQSSSARRSTPIDFSRSSQWPHWPSTASRSAGAAGLALVNVPFTW